MGQSFDAPRPMKGGSPSPHRSAAVLFSPSKGGRRIRPWFGMSVRRSVNAASERYLQRRHVRTASTGFATAASECVECDAEDDSLPSSIYQKMKDGREEGGEPQQ